MKHPFIKVLLISAQTEDLDHVTHIRADDIRSIHAATEQEKKQRQQINALIGTPGGMYAVAENPATILAKIEQATSDIPTSEE